MKRRTKARVVLGAGVIAGAVALSAHRRRRRIEVVDTTAPDAFGSAVVRDGESAPRSG